MVRNWASDWRLKETLLATSQSTSYPNTRSIHAAGSVDRAGFYTPEELGDCIMRCRRISCWALTLAIGLLTTTIRAQDKAPETTVPLNRDVPRHKQINERAAKGNVDLLFIGDSITQGWEGAGKEVWAKSYGSRNAMN